MVMLDGVLRTRRQAALERVSDEAKLVSVGDGE
jgi:hypothetical protein